MYTYVASSFSIVPVSGLCGGQLRVCVGSRASSMSGFSEGASADHYRDTDVEENTPGSYRQRSDSDLVRSYYYGSCDPAPTPPASEGQRTNWGFVRDDPSPEFGAGGRGNNGFGAGGERVVQRVSLELNEIGRMAF